MSKEPNGKQTEIKCNYLWEKPSILYMSKNSHSVKLAAKSAWLSS